MMDYNVNVAKIDNIDTIFLTHYKPLVNFASNLLYQKRNAEDVVQHAFFKFIRNGKNACDEQAVKILYSAVRNLAYDYNKKLYSKKTILFSETDHPNWEIPVDGEQRDSIFLDELIEKSGLSDEQLKVLVLSIEGYSHSQIAKITNLHTTDAVKQAKYRAKLKTRRLLP